MLFFISAKLIYLPKIPKFIFHKMPKIPKFSLFLAVFAENPQIYFLQNAENPQIFALNKMLLFLSPFRGCFKFRIVSNIVVFAYNRGNDSPSTVR